MGSSAPEPEASGYLKTASALHAFNRYEIKYLAQESDVPRLREALAAHMASDEFSPVGGYPVTSLYYDTQNLRFYWEKIEGLKAAVSLVQPTIRAKTEKKKEKPDGKPSGD